MQYANWSDVFAIWFHSRLFYGMLSISKRIAWDCCLLKWNFNQTSIYRIDCHAHGFTAFKENEFFVCNWWCSRCYYSKNPRPCCDETIAGKSIQGTLQISSKCVTKQSNSFENFYRMVELGIFILFIIHTGMKILSYFAKINKNLRRFFLTWNSIGLKLNQPTFCCDNNNLWMNSTISWHVT